MLDMILDFFVRDAWALAPPQGEASGPGGTLMAFAPLILMFVLFYFLLLRPQQKRQREIENMQNSLKKGDKVITTGGVYGLVEKVGDKTVTVKIAENTSVKFGRQFIAQVRESVEE